MIVERKHYVNELESSMHNGLIKVVTGLCRCGKSFLLNKLFRMRLSELGEAEENMLFLNMEDWRLRSLRNPDKLLEKIDAFATSNPQMHYVILDEVQMVEHFPEWSTTALKTFRKLGNLCA